MPDPSGSSRILAGRCLCGAVEYAVDDAFKYSLNCHCSDCRKATGAAFKSFAGIERDRVRLVKGREHVFIYGDPAANHDVRCQVCGSFLYSDIRSTGFAHVTLGTLVDTPTLRPTAHIFVGDKAPWFEVTDGLPQHEGHQKG